MESTVDWHFYSSSRHVLLYSKTPQTSLFFNPLNILLSYHTLITLYYIGRIGNPDSLMKIVEMVRRIEQQDEDDQYDESAREEL